MLRVLPTELCGMAGHDNTAYNNVSSQYSSQMIDKTVKDSKNV